MTVYLSVSEANLFARAKNIHGMRSDAIIHFEKVNWCRKKISVGGVYDVLQNMTWHVRFLKTEK